MLGEQAFQELIKEGETEVERPQEPQRGAARAFPSRPRLAQLGNFPQFFDAPCCATVPDAGSPVSTKVVPLL